MEHAFAHQTQPRRQRCARYCGGNNNNRAANVAVDVGVDNNNNRAANVAVDAAAVAVAVAVTVAVVETRLIASLQKTKNASPH
ncbi:MAG: hypothetical protein ACOC1J_01895 [Prolixibacteraceae bacterium]